MFAGVPFSGGVAKITHPPPEKLLTADKESVFSFAISHNAGRWGDPKSVVDEDNTRGSGHCFQMKTGNGMAWWKARQDSAEHYFSDRAHSALHSCGLHPHSC